MNSSSKIYLLLLSGFLCIAVCIPASADTVVPNYRVQSYLNVREETSGDSTTVGKLRKGESAELIESVPRWYKIRLNDGIVGYVSKSWSEVVTESENTGQVVRFGSWNMKKLGHGSRKDIRSMAEYIDSSFDLLVAIEVMQKGGSHPGYDELMSYLGSSWAGQITDTPRPRTSAGHSEYYAVLYRKQLIRPCDGWYGLVYHDDNDGTEPESEEDYFSREPAFGCYVIPLNQTEIGMDFILAAYHAVWGDGKPASIAKEVKHIMEVFDSMMESRQGEGDLIIAGDFNLVPDNMRNSLAVEIITQGSGSTLNTKGERTENLYDHILVYNRTATAEMISIPKVIDNRHLAANNKDYYDKWSDHLPIITHLRPSGRDDD
jgi:SH3 domain-containing protein